MPKIEVVKKILEDIYNLYQKFPEEAKKGIPPSNISQIIFKQTGTMDLGFEVRTIMHLRMIGAIKKLENGRYELGKYAYKLIEKEKI
jgi:hypothetical protein